MVGPGPDQAGALCAFAASLDLAIRSCIQSIFETMDLDWNRYPACKATCKPPSWDYPGQLYQPEHLGNRSPTNHSEALVWELSFLLSKVSLVHVANRLLFSVTEQLEACPHSMRLFDEVVPVFSMMEIQISKWNKRTTESPALALVRLFETAMGQAEERIKNWLDQEGWPPGTNIM